MMPETSSERFVRFAKAVNRTIELGIQTWPMELAIPCGVC